MFALSETSRAGFTALCNLPLAALIFSNELTFTRLLIDSSPHRLAREQCQRTAVPLADPPSWLVSASHARSCPGSRSPLTHRQLRFGDGLPVSRAQRSRVHPLPAT